MSTDNTITKTDLKNILEEIGNIGGGGGGGTSAYMVEFTYDQINDAWSADKTSQEIYEASEAGQNVVGYLIQQDTHDGDTIDIVSFIDLTQAHKLVESGTTRYSCVFSVYPDLVTSTSQINYYSYRLVYEDSTITPSFYNAEASTTPTSGDGAMYDSNDKLNSTDMSSADVTSFVNGLNVSGGSLGDFVTEQGTTTVSGTTWTYRKWNSGMLEAWGKDSQSWTMSNPISPLYYTMKSYNISSLGFTAIKNIQISAMAAGYYICTKVETYSTSSISLTAFATTSDTRTLEHSIYVVGTWK